MNSEAISANHISVPGLINRAEHEDNYRAKNNRPVVQANATRLPNTSTASTSYRDTAVREATGKPEWITGPTDTRVVELAFHPSLCRGSNRESEPAEDGLRLVFQPKNQQGEFVSQVAGMTIVVVDPARPEGESKIGRWTWTAEELLQSLEPIGSAQGFHVAIAWQAKRPVAKSVKVHVRYEMEDGRRLVNEKAIELYTPGLGSDAWTPRVPK
jgi:hypothetical protein